VQRYLAYFPAAGGQHPMRYTGGMLTHVADFCNKIALRTDIAERHVYVAE
jgi:hypothetical protein